MSNKGKKRARSSSSENKQLDSADIKSMFKSVMRKMNAIEQEQKRQRRFRRSPSPSYSSEYTGSDSESSHADVVNLTDESNEENIQEKNSGKRNLLV